MIKDRYMVISEAPTSPSKAQRYKSETRPMVDLQSAKDWREFIEGSYRKKKDKRDVLLVKVIQTSEEL